ncbi:ABC transporter ATP-binding protein [Azotosporobacter soli]|uniref:ABC transporter ATP-binding protein n=1 Tax=Azotosporobacter soli TaxID=3055040 RepID=UPI0031FF1F76
MIRLEQVVKKFNDQTAVDGISLHVRPGEIFGLVGPDGAGKTTLIRLILGLLPVSSGSIRLLESSSAESVKSQLGYVPQRFSLYGDLTVMENIRLLGALYGAEQAQVDRLGHEILTFTNLLPFKDRLADQLSGGMRQKLALAAGLMHRPKLFFLDEPTTGVDPVSRREFWHMLYHLNQEGMTIFVSTPYMEEAELCHRIAFQHQGRLAALGTPAELKQAYPHRLLELHAAAKDVRRHLHGDYLLDIDSFGEKYHIAVKNPDAALPLIRAQLAANDIPLLSLREITPTLEDVFVALSGKEDML